LQSFAIEFVSGEDISMKTAASLITIRLPDDVRIGLKKIAATEGESVGTIVRLLARQAIAQGGVISLAPRASISPLGRADK
jgi:hypothetical protein